VTSSSRHSAAAGGCAAARAERRMLTPSLQAHSPATRVSPPLAPRCRAASANTMRVPCLAFAAAWAPGWPAASVSAAFLTSASMQDARRARGSRRRLGCPATLHALGGGGHAPLRAAVAARGAEGRS
jgi:hypothetical protein